MPSRYTQTVTFITATVLCVLVQASSAFAWDFIWNTEGWSPDGALSQSYSNVNGSGVDIDVVVTGDTGNFNSNTPRINSNRLESYPVFNSNTQSVTYTFTFSQPVNIEDFNLWDIDGNNSSWADGLSITAQTVDGQTINPDNVIAGAHVVTVDPHTFETDGSGGLGSRTASGELTFDFSQQRITSMAIVHQVGHANPAITHTGAIWMDDFIFYRGHYTQKDSNDADCSPTYTDISGTGTALNLTDDSEANVTLPFSFLFYDTVSTSLRIGSNGGILFDATSGSLPASNTDIPASSPAPAILPYWDDLNPATGGDVYYQTLGTAPQRRFIVQWNNIPHYNNTGNATLQAILYEGTNDIFFYYQDVDFGDATLDNGASATIGLNYDQNTVDKYSFNQATLNGVSGICYFFPNDYGDAPASYGEVFHSIPLTQALSLGDATDLPDNETGMLYSGAADGDNADNQNDENGVTFRSPAGTGHSIFADVAVNNSTGSAVTLCGWLDTPAGGAVDGHFDLSDRVCQTTNGGTVTLQWSGLPEDQGYTSFARFRVCSTASDCNNPTSFAPNGEVEDYQVVFDFRPTAVTINKVELQALQVSEYLEKTNISHMASPALRQLLRTWNPAITLPPAGADKDILLEAVVKQLDPDNNGQVAVISWDTLEERGTIGFYVERQNADASWQRINNKMLPGLITAPMGGQYTLADPAVFTTGTYLYRLVEQDAWGHQHTYGPYSVEMK